MHVYFVMNIKKANVYLEVITSNFNFLQTRQNKEAIVNVFCIYLSDLRKSCR